MLTRSTEKYQQILQTAKRLYEQDPDWVTFFREVLGVDGMVRGSFTSLEELAAFEQSQEFEQIQKWLVRLRERRGATDAESEPTRIITVRLPKSVHEYLRTEAHDLRTSMNKLCISKLLQVIEHDLIPRERLETGQQNREELRRREQLRREISDMRARLQDCERALTGLVTMTNDSRPSVFVGSSVEGLPIVEAIVVNLERTCEVIPWTTMFDPSEFTLEALESNLDGFDFAILVLTADDIIESQGALSNAPRDNVLVELGLFMGKLGRRRTMIVTDRSIDLKLPTDLVGLTHASYSPHRNGNNRSALGAACVRIKDVITSLGPRNGVAAK